MARLRSQLEADRLLERIRRATELRVRYTTYDAHRCTWVVYIETPEGTEIPVTTLAEAEEYER